MTIYHSTTDLARRSLIAALLGICVLGISACGSNLPKYRYRLRISVRTPEGIVSGASVLEVSTFRAGDNTIPTPGAVRHSLRGQAIFVDLGERGKLLGLLASADGNVDWAKNILFRLTPPARNVPPGTSSRERFAARYAAMLSNRKPIEVPQYLPDGIMNASRPAWPMMVKLDNSLALETMVVVDPLQLPKYFGPGVEIDKLEAQITYDQVDFGIKKFINWLPIDYNSIPRNVAKSGIPMGDLQELFLRD